jgi:hypothetical protein
MESIAAFRSQILNETLMGLPRSGLVSSEFRFDPSWRQVVRLYFGDGPGRLSQAFTDVTSPHRSVYHFAQVLITGIQGNFLSCLCLVHHFLAVLLAHV